jgi:hypothetical protein
MAMMNTRELYFVWLKRDDEDDGEVFIARPKYISSETICFVSYCKGINHHVSDTYMYSIPSDWVKFYFKMSDLIEGKRYRFVDKNDKTYVAELVSYANYHVRLKVDDEAGITSMEIFHMRSIHFIHF